MTPQALQAQAPAAPFGGGSLSGGASTFTPRASKVIRFARPDGTAVDIKEAAAAVKIPTPVIPAATTPELKQEEAPPTRPEPPKKKLPSLPVVVRLESEEQKKARLVEEAQHARFKQEEEREERERKERKERSARQEEEAKAKETAALVEKPANPQPADPASVADPVEASSNKVSIRR